MHNHVLRSIGFCGLSALGLALTLQAPALAADDAKPADEAVTVNIIRNEMGRFVFDPEKLEINKGQEIEWKAATGGENITHQLVPKTDKDAFVDTGEFEGSIKQKFETCGVIKYECAIHPSMQGTITVK